MVTWTWEDVALAAGGGNGLPSDSVSLLLLYHFFVTLCLLNELISHILLPIDFLLLLSYVNRWKIL